MLVALAAILALLTEMLALVGLNAVVHPLLVAFPGTLGFFILAGGMTLFIILMMLLMGTCCLIAWIGLRRIIPAPVRKRWDYAIAQADADAIYQWRHGADAEMPPLAADRLNATLAAGGQRRRRQRRRSAEWDPARCSPTSIQRRASWPTRSRRKTLPSP
jgi:hypothetical protein